MQDHDWDDLKLVLAVYRADSLAEAARRLGINETTVARRLRRLEHALGATLFLRATPYGHTLTELGRAILQHAEAIERAHHALRERLRAGSAAPIAGTVRISAAPVLARSFMLPQLAGLLALHPDLRVELVPEPRNVDLTRREADLAVRFARPRRGGHRVMAQRLAALDFDLFAVAGQAKEGDPRWICYEPGGASLPQARWTETLRARAGGAASRLQVADLETAFCAARAGLGVAVLPIEMGAGLCRTAPGLTRPQMRREVWLLRHADPHPSRAAEAARAWICALPWQGHKDPGADHWPRPPGRSR